MPTYICTYNINDCEYCFFTDSLKDAREQMRRHEINPGRIFRVGQELPIGGHGRGRNERVYLDCPYDEKDYVKRLGAKWDAYRTKWYVPFNLSLDSFSPWLPDRWQAKIVEESHLTTMANDSHIDNDDDVIDDSDVGTWSEKIRQKHEGKRIYPTEFKNRIG